MFSKKDKSVFSRIRFKQCSVDDLHQSILVIDKQFAEESKQESHIRLLLKDQFDHGPFVCTCFSCLSNLVLVFIVYYLWYDALPPNQQLWSWWDSQFT